MSDLLFFFHLGDFHYEDINDTSVVPRLEAYDDALRRESVGDLFRQLPITYCWDDHDFLANNSQGGDPAHAAARRTGGDAYDLYVPHYPLAAPPARLSRGRPCGSKRKPVESKNF